MLVQGNILCSVRVEGVLLPIGLQGTVNRSPSLEEGLEFVRAYFLPKVPAVSIRLPSDVKVPALSIRLPLNAMMIFR